MSQSYEFIQAIEVDANDYELVKEHFENLKGEAPMFYKYDLVDMEGGKTITKRISSGDVLGMLKATRLIPKYKTEDYSAEVAKVLKLIKSEVERSVAKYGIQDRPPLEWIAILGEEFGEASQTVVEKSLIKSGKYTWDDYRKEMIQVACVAINALTSLNRNELNK
jgi:hypothetical protein